MCGSAAIMCPFLGLPPGRGGSKRPLGTPVAFVDYLVADGNTSVCTRATRPPSDTLVAESPFGEGRRHAAPRVDDVDRRARDHPPSLSAARETGGVAVPTGCRDP